VETHSDIRTEILSASLGEVAEDLYRFPSSLQGLLRVSEISQHQAEIVEVQSQVRKEGTRKDETEISIQANGFAADLDRFVQLAHGPELHPQISQTHGETAKEFFGASTMEILPLEKPSELPLRG
jgi:hypothetical protein